MSDELKPASMVVAAWQYRRFDVYWKNQPASWSNWWDCSEREAKEHAKAANTEVRPLYAVAHGAAPSKPAGGMQGVEALLDAYVNSLMGTEYREMDGVPLYKAMAKEKAAREALTVAIRKLLEAKGEDAARYQWLRDVGDASWTPLRFRHGYSAKNADAAIDAARSEVKP